MSVSSRTAAGELPSYFELDPLRFQELCRDLWQMEKEFEDVEIYGTKGQSQRGIDVLATRKDGKGLATGQCKCVVPSSFNAGLIINSVDEFLKHKLFWLKQGAKTFALFVASNASPRQIQDEKLKQTRRLKQAGFKFELWSAAKITNKLRPHPGIVRTYLDEHWVPLRSGAELQSHGSSAPQDRDDRESASFSQAHPLAVDSIASGRAMALRMCLPSTALGFRCFL
jgi:hypothetical protein